MGAGFNPLNSVINPQQQQQIASLVQAAQGNSAPLATSGPPEQMPMPGTVQQAAPQSALPPSSPFDLGATYHQLASQPEIQKPLAGMEDVRSQLAQKQQQMEGMTPPQTAPHNLALRILAATVPGRAISNAVYQPGVTQYNRQRQQLADQIATLKDQAAISESELGKGAQLGGTAAMAGYHGAEIGVQQERNTIAKQRSDTQATNVARQSANDLVRQSQGWQRLSQDQQKVALQQWFQKAEIDVAQQRVNAGMDENSARIQAQQDVQAELAQNKFASAHPILGPLLQGMGMAPQLTSTPAAQTPKVMAKPTPAATSKPANKKGDPLGIL